MEEDAPGVEAKEKDILPLDIVGRVVQSSVVAMDFTSYEGYEEEGVVVGFVRKHGMKGDATIELLGFLFCFPRILSHSYNTSLQLDIDPDSTFSATSILHPPHIELCTLTASHTDTSPPWGSPVSPPSPNHVLPVAVGVH